MFRFSPAIKIAPLLVALALTVLVTACESAADLLPGEPAPEVTVGPDATPTAVIAPPILPPSSVGIAGEQPRNGAPAEAIADTELARSVVQLQLFDTSGGFVRLVRDGSGVVIDRPQRLILTSYALVNPFRSDGSSAYTSIAIAVNRETGGEPALAFEAELVAADPATDLAVLRATRLYRGGSIGTGEFDLPAVTFGDADALVRGDTLRLLGYPGLQVTGEGASQALVATTATVDGFRGHATIEGRAWLKTDLRLPYGFSGGPAFNAAGALVGVATQIEYDPFTVVGQVRPLTLATGPIEAARRAAPEARYRAPLQRRAALPAPPQVNDRFVVETPAFAENAVEGSGELDLFDYTSQFPSELPALYYEYAAQGIVDGTLIEERWYLDGVLQDSLSSSFHWSLGPFGIVTDRLLAPSARRIPTGVWVLEVWVDEALRSRGTTYIAAPPQGEPSISSFRFASRVEGGEAAAAPTSREQQLLAFFDYEDAAGATQMRWIVFHDGRVVYQSPLVPWEGGEEGSWWVGFSADSPIGPGLWEFEIYLDSPDPQQPVSRGADGIELN